MPDSKGIVDLKEKESFQLSPVISRELLSQCRPPQFVGFFLLPEVLWTIQLPIPTSKQLQVSNLFKLIDVTFCLQFASQNSTKSFRLVVSIPGLCFIASHQWSGV